MTLISQTGLAAIHQILTDCWLEGETERKNKMEKKRKSRLEFAVDQCGKKQHLNIYCKEMNIGTVLIHHIGVI